jgi:hypothetical protein
MLDYLDGEIGDTPWHGAPLDPESERILPSLRSLTAAGFLTTNSQPGGIDRWGIQRAYMEGLAEPEVAERLIERARAAGLYVAVNVRQREVDRNGLRYRCVSYSWKRGRVTGTSVGVADQLTAYELPEGVKRVVAGLTTVCITDPAWVTNRMWQRLVRSQVGTVSRVPAGDRCS